MKYRFLGKEKKLSLGSYPDVTLANAREKRNEAKRQLKCLDFETLKDFCRSLKNSELLAQVESLQKYEMKDITGLQAHLKILVNSAMGKYFEPADNMFTLEEVIKDDALVYFSLPALRYPSFSKVLGKLVINDIKATIEDIKTISVFSWYLMSFPCSLVIKY